MKVKKGGGGTGLGAEPAPGASNRSVEPTREPRVDSESGSESEPEPGPGPRLGPLQGKQTIGPDDVLGLQRITGGEHQQGSATRGLEGERGRGPTRLRVWPPLTPPPCSAPPVSPYSPTVSKPEISIFFSLVSCCAPPHSFLFKGPTPFPMVEVGQQLLL